MTYLNSLIANITLTLIALLILACGVHSGEGSQFHGQPIPEQSSDQDTPADPPPADGANHPTDPQPPAMLTLQTGVRNYAEINATMSVLTGVSPATANVKAAFDLELSTALPAGNDVQAFLGSHQVAVTKLAVEYCDALFENATLRTQLIPGFNFTAAPSAAFTPASKALVAQSLIDRFWGVNMSNRPGTPTMQPVAVSLLDDILVGKTLTDVNVTRNVVKGVCIALLASAPVTMF